jgi:hypothetical protein
MRLRVKIRNSKECRVELPFPDLSVKYNNGYAPSLRIKEGHEIPLDVLDPEDIRKSLKVGSLKGYLDNGWIEEIPENEIVEEPISVPLSHFITEQMVLAPKVAPVKTEVVLPAQKEVSIPQPNLPEVEKVVDKQVPVSQNEPITDFKLVKTYEDFIRLTHFLKLRFIKETDDITLLKDILGKTSSAQFKNNIILRLSQIKI